MFYFFILILDLCKKHNTAMSEKKSNFVEIRTTLNHSLHNIHNPSDFYYEISNILIKKVARSIYPKS